MGWFVYSPKEKVQALKALKLLITLSSSSAEALSSSSPDSTISSIKGQNWSAFFDHSEHLCPWTFPVFIKPWHTNWHLHIRTCCSSSEESWRSSSCSGWESPPWQQPSLCLFQVDPRCSACPSPLLGSPLSLLRTIYLNASAPWHTVSHDWLTIISQTCFPPPSIFAVLVDAVQSKSSGVLQITHE